MIGDLFINGVDAYERYGISLEPSGVSELMTPPSMKEVIENKSRLQHGVRTLNVNPRIEAREITVPMHINARDTDSFLKKYALFCDEVLSIGQMVISTRYQQGVYYKFIYVSCSQFSEFMLSYAAFSLKMREPDPTDRGLESAEAWIERGKALQKKLIEEKQPIG